MELERSEWTCSDVDDFLNYLALFGKGEEKGAWEKRIVNTSLPCIAVPSGEVDRIAREIFKGNYTSFLDLWIWENHTATLIFGKIVSKIKKFSEQVKYLVPYSEKADNWSTIDTLKFRFNSKNISDYLRLSEKLLCSNFTFSRRLALIILLKLLSVTDCTDVAFKALNSLSEETEYYVNMAGAWLMCECMIKFRDKAVEYYRVSTTNDFIVNKSISKCRDSFRVSERDKEFLLGFKR